MQLWKMMIKLDACRFSMARWREEEGVEQCAGSTRLSHELWNQSLVCTGRQLMNTCSGG